MKRVALLGPYSSRNLGDTATQLAVMAQLRDRIPDLEIVGIAHEPDDVLTSLSIPAFPLDGNGPSSGALAPRFPDVAHSGFRALDALRAATRMYDFVKDLDLLIVSGGGQLDDFWGGPWDHPRLLLQWIFLARRARVPAAFLGVGVDRLDSRISQRFSVLATQGASYLSFRDQDSLHRMRELGMTGASATCPDVVFGLEHSFQATPLTHRPFAAINPVSRNTWAHHEDQRHAIYMNGLLSACEWLATQGLDIRIACSQTRMDPPDAVQLRDRLNARGIMNVEVAPVQSVPQFLNAVRGAEVVIAARFHGVVLSLVAGTPVLALAPLPKVSSVMANIGLSRFCLDLRSFESSSLVERTTRIYSERDDIRRHVHSRVQELRSDLVPVYADIVGLLRT